MNKIKDELVQERLLRMDADKKAMELKMEIQLAKQELEQSILQLSSTKLESDERISENITHWNIERQSLLEQQEQQRIDAEMILKTAKSDYEKNLIEIRRQYESEKVDINKENERRRVNLSASKWS